MSTEHIYILINKHLTGDLTEEEQKDLERWLNESEENHQQFSKASEIWRLTGKVTVDLSLDNDFAWQQISQNSGLNSTRKINWWNRPVMKIAASLLLLFGLGALFFLLTPENIVKHQTADTERRHLMLPDSSEVWLNENSSLSYQQNFEKGRAVELSGEAYFEVRHQDNNPFTVTTNSVKTTVLGTSFVVSDYYQNLLAEVVLTSGKLKVDELREQSNTVFLEPGTSAVLDRSSGRLVKTENTDPNLLAWKNRQLKFENTDVDEIEQVLERYFRIELSLANSQLRSCQFTGTFVDPTIEEVLQVMSIALDISYKREEEEYILSGDGCNAGTN